MLEAFYSEEGSCSREVLLVTVDVFTDLKTSVFPDQLKSPFAENNFIKRNKTVLITSDNAPY